MIATLIPAVVAAPARYRYIAENRGIDQPSTKRFRKKMRKLTFEILADDGAYAQVKGSDNNYYNWMPLDHLELVSETGGVE